MDEEGKKFYAITEELKIMHGEIGEDCDLSWKDCFDIIDGDFSTLCYYAKRETNDESKIVIDTLNELAHDAILCRIAYENEDLKGPRFGEIIEDMKKIHDAKRHDYASDEDRFSNLAISEKMGIPAWKGCLVRISDKYSRLDEFTKKEELMVKDESITDTLNDMANYAIICRILYERGPQPVKEGIDITDLFDSLGVDMEGVDMTDWDAVKERLYSQVYEKKVCGCNGDSD